MDDPLFDPWGVEAEEPDAPRAPARWRAPAGPGPQLPPATNRSDDTPETGPDSSAPPAPRTRRPQRPAPAKARLAGTAGFLRSMAVPRLERMAARLQLARHEAFVEDRLDGAPPAVRFEARLRRGPWSPEGDGPGGVLELSLAGEGDGPVRVRTWLGDESSEPHSELSIPPVRLDARTVERLALTVLETLVDRS